MLFASFKYSSISVATTIYHVQPFIFLFLWSWLSRERIPLIKIVYTVIAFIGVIFVIDVFNNIDLNQGYFIGVILALTAALFWAISALIVKRIDCVKPHLTVLIQLCVGVIIVLPFVDFVSMTEVTKNEWLYLVIIGVIHSCVVYILMYSSYKVLSAPVIAIMTFIYPCVAIMVDVMIFNKQLDLMQWLGITMILLSSYISSQNIQTNNIIRRLYAISKHR